jgi:ABC-2 type transport system ATP-binding protein
MPPDTEQVVRLAGLQKSFVLRHFLHKEDEGARRRFYVKRRVEAVRDVSFDIHPGEIFGLLGPNGAGKTTTVKMLSGLVKPDAGAVYIDGLEVERNRKRILQKVGVVLEGTRTSMWPLTPLENLAYYGNLKNVSGKILKARSHELLDFIGLKDKKHVQVRHLSRGQKQKLAICIAMIADPKVLLLDEPTTGLDVQSARAIKDKIIEVTRDHGKSVLVTTHDMHVAQELCDRIGIIDKGQLVACKPTPELLGLFSDQVYVFKTDRDVDTAPFEVIPGVIGASVERSVEGPLLVMNLALDLPTRSEALYAIVETLRRHQYQLQGVSERQQNLETVFLRLTTSSMDSPAQAPKPREQDTP